MRNQSYFYINICKGDQSAFEETVCDLLPNGLPREKPKMAKTRNVKFGFILKAIARILRERRQDTLILSHYYVLVEKLLV